MEYLFQLARLALLLLFLRGAWAGFGDDISQDNEDNRFAEMGQVTINDFDVVDGDIRLVLEVQDTKDIPELWILDFEPYRFNEDALPINELTGWLVLENTGECSSVYESVEWTFFDDTYFKDRNAADLAAKELFTEFEYGDTYNANNTRTDYITYSGDFSTFFDCKKSDGFTKVWEKTSNESDDEIEYKTRLYTTNVRPKDPEDRTAGISFVQSHIVLIWRLSRQAIGNFIISSTAILRPVIDFARVSAVFDTQGDPIPEQARMHLRFTTILDSKDQKLAYSTTGFTFTPDNPLHGLNATVYQPETALDSAPDCTLTLDVGTKQHLQCYQTWDFVLILDVDTTTQLIDSVPIDASATLDFFFDVYECNDTTSACSRAVEDAQVTTLITIQTVVFIRDEEEDQFTLLLMALTGANDHTLDSSQPGARPVSHKEDVTLKVKFSPAVLRSQFDLKLMLFMVCKGDIEGAQGCLDEDIQQRYIAAQDPDFSYTVDVNGTEVTYSAANLTEDYVQQLSTNQYNAETADTEPHHVSQFTNLALSAEHSKYTITTIYELVENGLRKKRDADTADATNMIRTGILTTTSFSTRVLPGRVRRDIDDSADLSHGLRVGMGAAGCPEGSTYIPEAYDCQCPADTVYDLVSFQCVKNDNRYDIDQDIEKDDDVLVDVTANEESGADLDRSSLYLVILLNTVLIRMMI